MRSSDACGVMEYAGDGACVTQPATATRYAHCVYVEFASVMSARVTEAVVRSAVAAELDVSAEDVSINRFKCVSASKFGSENFGSVLLRVTAEAVVKGKQSTHRYVAKTAGPEGSEEVDFDRTRSNQKVDSVNLGDATERGDLLPKCAATPPGVGSGHPSAEMLLRQHQGGRHGHERRRARRLRDG